MLISVSGDITLIFGGMPDQPSRTKAVLKYIELWKNTMY